MSRSAIRVRDVARLVRGAIQGGLDPERICVRLIDGAPAIIQIDPLEAASHDRPEASGTAGLDDAIRRLIDDDG
jgi:hypothetical protein